MTLKYEIVPHPFWRNRMIVRMVLADDWPSYRERLENGDCEE